MVWVCRFSLWTGKNMYVNLNWKTIWIRLWWSRSQIDSDIFAFKRISDQNRTSSKSGKNEENDEQAFEIY